MALPEQIRKQSEDVQKLYEEINRPAEPAAAPKDAGDAGQVAPPAAAPVDTAAAPPPAPAQEQQPTADEYAQLEQRYRSLQGTYNAQVPQLRAENKQLSQRVSQMEQLLSTLSQTPPAAKPGATGSLITDKDVSEYGDSIDVMRRAARAEVQQELSEMRQLINQLTNNVVPRVDQVVQRQALNSEQAFWNDLAVKVPNWQQINSDKAFHDWLMDVDPMTGLNRQAYLDDAQNQMDAGRVATIFKAWLENSGATAQTTRSTPADELNRQIAPGRGRTAAPSSAPNAAKTYTPQEVQKFYDDVRRGLFKGREEERGRIERDIFAAQREGRLIATG